jgi:hypothetical protein
MSSSFWRLAFRRYSARKTAIIDLPYISIAICGAGGVSSAAGLLGDPIYGLGVGFCSHSFRGLACSHPRFRVATAGAKTASQADF